MGISDRTAPTDSNDFFGFNRAAQTDKQDEIMASLVRIEKALESLPCRKAGRIILFGSDGMACAHGCSCGPITKIKQGG